MCGYATVLLVSSVGCPYKTCPSLLYIRFAYFSNFSFLPRDAQILGLYRQKLDSLSKICIADRQRQYVSIFIRFHAIIFRSRAVSAS